MSIHGMSLIPLILSLQNTSNTKQCCLADNASGARIHQRHFKMVAVTKENGAYVWVSPERNKMLADCEAK